MWFYVGHTDAIDTWETPNPARLEREGLFLLRYIRLLHLLGIRPWHLLLRAHDLALRRDLLVVAGAVLVPPAERQLLAHWITCGGAGQAPQFIPVHPG